MEFQERDTYFYQQTAFRKLPRRYKKLPEELPQDLRFAHLNPRVAAYLANKEKEKQEEVDDGLGGKSLLPQINQTVSLIRQRLDSLLSTDSDSQRILYEQAKHASDDILTQLANVLYLFEGLHVPIPKSLEHALLNGWKELTQNASTAQREWQSLAAKEAWESSRRRPPSAVSDRTSSRPGSTTGGRNSARDLEASPRDGEDAKDAENVKKARAKLASRTGNLEGIAEDEEADLKQGASKLPDGGGPTSVPVPLKRKESQSSLMRSKSRSTIVGGRPPSGRASSLRRKDDGSVMESFISEGVRSSREASRDVGYYAVIQFQLSSKACDDKGWILHREADDLDGEQVYELAVQRLQGVLKSKKEQEQEDAEKGRDTALVLRLYGDKRKEELQKYKRTGSSDGAKSGRKGQKPRIPPMEPQLDPSKPLLMCTVSDGSSTVFYPSGRPAIVVTRNQTSQSSQSPAQVLPGFYTLVYDNSPEQRTLACFTPSGRACCYHPNGNIRFIATEAGGTTADENGAITKRWEWPTGGPAAKLPIPVIVPLNHNISFRCQNQYQMQLFFQCHKEQAKFNVGKVTDDPPAREEMGKLLTGYIFTSHAAKEFAKAYKKQSKKKAKSKTGFLNDASPMNPFRQREGPVGLKGLVHRSNSSLGLGGGAGAALARHVSCPAPSPGSSTSSPGLIGASAPSSLLLAAMKNSMKVQEASDLKPTESGSNTPRVGVVNGDSEFSTSTDTQSCPIIKGGVPIASLGPKPPERPSSGKRRMSGVRPKSGLKLDTNTEIPVDGAPVSNDEVNDTKESPKSSPARSRKSFSSVLRSSMTGTVGSPGQSRAGSPGPRSRDASPVLTPAGTPPPGTPAWPKSSKKQHTDSIQDLQKSLDMQEVTENDAEADTVLVKLQRKARNLVEDWQEHYRMAMSIQSPDLHLVRDRPRKDRGVSAKSSPGGGGIVIIEPTSTQVPRADVSGRVPSAPVARVTEKLSPISSPVPNQQEQQAQPEPAPAVKFDDNPPEEFEAVDQRSLAASTPFPASLFSRSASSPGLRSLRTKSAPQRLGTTPSIPEQITPAVSLCPVALRQSLLGEERPMCRCSRHKIPVITDIEYDEYIDNQAPEKQMIIVSVISSLFPEATPAQEMLESLYADKNRNRTRPCVQGRQDPVRLLLYDVASAAEFSDHTQPLLLRRHNVVPSMFLMYEGGRLIFCDHIFNGYGNARKDFQKQIMQTRRNANLGYGIPKDFRFSPAKGRHGPRSAWGGEIGGAGVGRHANPGVSLDSEAVKRSSLTSLSSDGSDNTTTRQLRLSGLNPTASKCIKMLSAPIHQVMMVEKRERDRLRSSLPSKTQITIDPPTPRTERSVTLPVVTKPGNMHTLRVS